MIELDFSHEKLNVYNKALDFIEFINKLSLSGHGKSFLLEIVSMLTGLLRSTSGRVYENEIDYNISNPKSD